MQELDVSREILAKLREYESLLVKWNKKINLVSKNDLSRIWTRHILDSIQLSKFVSNDDEIVDVGSGAGFPGIVLSLIGVKNVTLVESDVRKAAFLLNASMLSECKVNVVNARIEVVTSNCDIVTSRAFASVSKTLELCKNLKVKKKIILLKGVNVMSEIIEAKKNWKFDYNISARDKSYIVEIFI